MKLLLDECVNQRFRTHLPGHDVFTVGFLGWSGLKNGVLLRTAADAGFDAMITTDRAMPDQHHAATLPLAVFVLRPGTDQLADLVALAPALIASLAKGRRASCRPATRWYFGNRSNGRRKKRPREDRG